MRQCIIDDRLSGRLRCGMPKPSKEKPPAHTAEDKQSLGDQLAKARKDAGFSLTSAAVALRKEGHEIGRAAIGHWETGTNVVDALWLRRLARLYKTTSDKLLFGRPGTEVDLPPEIAELAESIALLPETLQGDVLAGIRNLLHLAQGAATQGNALSGLLTQENMNAEQTSVKRMKEG